MLEENELEERVKKVLSDLEFPFHLCGYKYLVTALVETILRPELCDRMVTKELYPLVAKRHRVNPASVEKGIRKIINKVMGECKQEVLKKYFDDGNLSVTNTNFIAKVSAYLREGKDLRIPDS